MRLMLIALAVVAVLYWLSRLRRRGPRAGGPAPGPRGEAMRQCAHCGAHFPESEAEWSPSGEVFCSEQHRLRHGGH